MIMGICYQFHTCVVLYNINVDIWYLYILMSENKLSSSFQHISLLKSHGILLQMNSKSYVCQCSTFLVLSTIY